MPEPIIAPVRNFLLAFEEHLDIAKELANGTRTVWVSTLDSIPVKEAKAAERRLRACLLMIGKASS